MLAEKKYKANYVLNPRGPNEWVADKSKFGQRMLERMGWKEGKGLGKDESGPTEHLRVSYKCNSSGLGFVGNPDTVEPLYSEYDKLLSDLQAKQSMSDEANDKSSSNDEAPSKKTIKTRHRYHKTLKAKNVSQYSVNDLAAIFGTKPSELQSVQRHRPEPEDSTSKQDTSDECRAMNVAECNDDVDESEKKRRKRERKEKRRREREAEERQRMVGTTEASNVANDAGDELEVESRKVRKSEKRKRKAVIDANEVQQVRGESNKCIEQNDDNCITSPMRDCEVDAIDSQPSQSTSSKREKRKGKKRKMSQVDEITALADDSEPRETVTAVADDAETAAAAPVTAREKRRKEKRAHNAEACNDEIAEQACSDGSEDRRRKTKISAQQSLATADNVNSQNKTKKKRKQMSPHERSASSIVAEVATLELELLGGYDKTNERICSILAQIASMRDGIRQSAFGTSTLFEINGYGHGANAGRTSRDNSQRVARYRAEVQTEKSETKAANGKKMEDESGDDEQLLQLSKLIKTSTLSTGNLF